MAAPLIELKQLACERDGRTLFSNLNYQARSGDIVQVLGPNGSGKTTLLRIITGISNDFEGELYWQGSPMAKASLDFHNHLLYIGHLPAIQRSLTAEENLRWFSGLDRGHQQISISDALREVGLAGYDDVPCHQLSAGQLRRVALARLVLTPALLWILDEPFTAVDAKGVERLRSLIQEHASGGGVVILTTHQDPAINDVKVLNLKDFQGEGCDGRY